MCAKSLVESMMLSLGSENESETKDFNQESDEPDGFVANKRTNNVMLWKGFYKTET